jgi:hypothetical protein
VRVRKYDVSIANTTAIAKGVKRYLAAPDSKNTGMKTMQMDRVAMSVGVAIWEAPSRIAFTIGFFIAILRFVFSISTVASSTRMPTAKASPPRVITLIVSPKALRIMIELRMERGIETQTIMVLRTLPRKKRIITPVRAAAIVASRTTSLTAARTNMD